MADQTEKSESQAFKELAEGLKACRRCQELFGFEPRPIQWGSEQARVMLISQAPGIKVHELGRPFADLSGKKLRQQWLYVTEEQFYNPDLFYFSQAGHCYPGRDPKGGDKKPPKCCWTLWSSREVELLKNVELYIVIGAEAASRVFPGRSLEELVFSDLTLQGKPCFVLPHPSPLNYRWPKNHPEFGETRLPALRKKLYEIQGFSREQMERFEAGQVPKKESWQLEKKPGAKPAKDLDKASETKAAKKRPAADAA